MKALILLISLLLLQPLLAFTFAGQDIGNGGDLILCHANPSLNNLDGLYALDYLLANSAEQAEFYQPKTLDHSLDRIEKLLKEKVPELWASFHDFREQLFMRDLLSTRIWEAAAYQLINITDEQLGLSDQIPKNCKNAQGIQISQAVIHLAPGFSGAGPGVTMYRYMPEIIKELSQSRPLQSSFLLVHEWLWDHSSNVDRNRRINKFLHSNSLTSMTRTQILTLLDRLGLKIEITNSKAGGVFHSNFYSFSCPHKGPKFEKLISSKPKEAGYLFPGSSYQHYRSRKCNTHGCAPWTDLRVGVLHFIFSSNNFYFSDNTKPTRQNDIEATCTLKNKEIECKVKHDESRTLLGSANETCLRVDHYSTGDVEKDQSWTEYHYTYFSNLDTNPLSKRP